ncbi:MAG: DUF1566 domain-containing protein [Spirochaetaceae bacterium]|nr:MAG: DUF1566 domain-containing protein [Spirochaetaceae bacterium]
MLGTTLQGIGSGLENTLLIIAQPGHTTSAALVASNATFGGYLDWFLPSRDELVEMNTRLQPQTTYGFVAGNPNYWSSTENVTATSAIARNIGQQVTQGLNKEQLHYVRPARRF